MGFRRLSAAAAALVVVAVASPVSAHEEHALYALTVIDTIPPELDGVEVRLVHLDSPGLVLTNETSETVTVLGEKGEPFLEIGPDGVRANTESPTTYRSSVPRREVTPPGLKPGGPPEWVLFSEEPSWTWFDPRLRFEPGRQSWDVPVEVGGRAAAIAGGFESLEGHGHFITAIDPPKIEGLDLRLTQGSIPAMFVRNDTGETLEVVGDSGEPFLRIAPDGVEANLRSPTYYTSGSTAIQKVPPIADAGAKPRWSAVSNVPVWAWLERRAAIPTELYQRSELGDERRTILEWTSNYTLGGEALAVQGHVEWVPPVGGTPSPAEEDELPWPLVLGVAFAGVAAAAMLLIRRPASPST